MEDKYTFYEWLERVNRQPPDVFTGLVWEASFKQELPDEKTSKQNSEVLRKQHFTYQLTKNTLKRTRKYPHHPGKKF